jgi:hypothetical protein
MASQSQARDRHAVPLSILTRNAAATAMQVSSSFESEDPISPGTMNYQPDFGAGSVEARLSTNHYPFPLPPSYRTQSRMSVDESILGIENRFGEARRACCISGTCIAEQEEDEHIEYAREGTMDVLDAELGVHSGVGAAGVVGEKRGFSKRLSEAAAGLGREVKRKMSGFWLIPHRDSALQLEDEEARIGLAQGYGGGVDEESEGRLADDEDGDEEPLLGDAWVDRVEVACDRRTRASMPALTRCPAVNQTKHELEEIARSRKPSLFLRMFRRNTDGIQTRTDETVPLLLANAASFSERASSEPPATRRPSGMPELSAEPPDPKLATRTPTPRIDVSNPAFVDHTNPMMQKAYAREISRRLDMRMRTNEFSSTHRDAEYRRCLGNCTTTADQRRASLSHQEEAEREMTERKREFRLLQERLWRLQEPMESFRGRQMERQRAKRCERLVLDFDVEERETALADDDSDADSDSSWWSSMMKEPLDAI